MRNPLILIAMLAVTTSASAQVLYNTSPSAQSGQQVYGSYFNGDIDSVSLYNGNLSLAIPVVALSGRELSTGVSLSYNSGRWETATCGQDPCGNYTGGWRTVTPVSDSLSFYAEHDTCEYDGGWWRAYFFMNVYWIDGSGAKHRYMVRVMSTDPYTQSNCLAYAWWAPPSFDNRTIASMDSDGSVLWTGTQNSQGSDPAKITMRNGAVRYFRNSYNTSNVPYDIGTLNGNYLNLGSNLLPSQDTLGRAIQYECVATCNAHDNQVRYKIYDSTGTLRTYKVQFQSLSVTDPVNSASKTLHDLVQYIELPNEKKYEFEYDHSQGFLTKVILPSGGYIRYVYPSPATTQANSNVIERRVSADGSTEKTWSYSGNSSGSGSKTVTVNDPEGAQTYHQFSAQGTEYFTASKATPGGTTLKSTETTWEQASVAANGQPVNPIVVTTTTTMKDGAQSKRAITYDSDRYVTQEKVWEWGEYGVGGLVLQKDLTYTTITGSFKRPATETLTAYNPANNSWTTQGKTEYFYDDYSLTNRGSNVPNHTHSTTASGRGLLTRVRKYKDATNYLESQMKYDNVGNLIETIDPLSHSTTIDFTDNFTDSTNRYTFALPKTVTNALSQYATSKYDWNTGLVKEVTNLRGYTTTTAYDAMNRVTSITEPNNKVTTYAYNDTTRVTTKQVTVVTSVVGEVKTTFDKLYRVIQTWTNDPDPGGAYVVDTEYDGNGRVKKTSNPYRSGESVLWTQTAYDALSRPTTVTAPDSSTIQYAYVNNITTTTDQAGNQRRYTYNVLGHLTKVEEPNPTLYTPIATTYKYYGFGPLYQSSQSSQTRTWVYNWIGQMTSQVLPESGTTSFTYDGGGRLSTKTDARSVVTTMAYDNANRVTQRSYSDSTPTVGFTYDQSSQTGLRTAMSDGLGSVTYTYDTMDRLTQESRTLTGISGTFSTSYAYNIKGDVTQMTYPSGRVVDFTYATDGGCCNSRLKTVKDDTTDLTLLDDIRYKAHGGVDTQTLNPGANAITEEFNYNDRLQLTQIQAAKGGTTVMDFNYDYGTSSTNTGRVLKRTDAIQPEHSANYVYDSLYRLANAVGADGSWALSWGLDTWGNRTSQTPLGLATSKVGSQSIAYTNNKNQAHTYDSAGNTTNDGVNNFAYNAENQQTSMGGGTATYAYDGEGRRMKKTASSETTYTFYGRGGILCEFTTLNTGATAASSTDKTIYRTSEKTGTAVFLFNTSGTVIENNRTLPYGEAWLADVASANDKKFTTYDRDKESGLDYAMNRMYANTGGRFTTPDKGRMVLNIPSTLNRYTYGSSDPINHVDPSGNYWILTWTLAPRMEMSIPEICAGVGGYSAGGGGIQETGDGFWVACNVWVPPLADSAAYAEEPEQQTGGGGGAASGPRIGAVSPFNSSQMAIVQAAVLAALNAVMTRSDCASNFGGVAAFQSLWNTVTIDFSNNYQDPTISRSEWEYNNAERIAYNVDSTTKIYLVDRNYGLASSILGGSPGFFNLTAGARALTLLHEMQHVKFGPAYKKDIDRPARVGDLATDCGLPNPQEPRNWVRTGIFR